VNIQQLLNKGYEILKENNVDSYMIDCQLLLSKVLRVDRLSIIVNRDLIVEEDKMDEFLGLINLRKNKMPIKYILGNSEFMGIDFIVRPGVLIPRPDTEILVEEVLKLIEENKSTKICDVCCGSGAIGVSIGKLNESTKVECYDISDTACEVTDENIKALALQERVKVVHSDLLQEAILSKKIFEVIVSNPPYIREAVIPTLMEDVKNFEPYIALSGGRDGLEFYKRITAESIDTLIKGGILAFEIGHDQKEEVSGILHENGFSNIRCIKDLAGNDRVIVGILK